MCGCMRVYAYLVGCLNQRALLDQHSHCLHVPVLTRPHQRCRTVLPSQPASVRRSGAAAATQATVHVWCMHVFPCIMCEIKQDHVRAFMRRTVLDLIRMRWTYVTEEKLTCISLEQTTLTRLACAAQPQIRLHCATLD